MALSQKAEYLFVLDILPQGSLPGCSPICYFIWRLFLVIHLGPIWGRWVLLIPFADDKLGLGERKGLAQGYTAVYSDRTRNGNVNLLSVHPVI